MFNVLNGSGKGRARALEHRRTFSTLDNPPEDTRLPFQLNKAVSLENQKKMGSTDWTMRAAQWDPTQQMAVVNIIPLPKPGPNQMLVKMASASLCHSDLMSINRPNLTDPSAIGHEGAGYVYQLAIAGFGDFGFFQEYAAVDLQDIIHLPEALDPKKSSAIFCAGITAFHAVDACDLKKAQWLAVVGAGGLGQLATQYAKAMGFQVISIDINDNAPQACEEQGADFIINSTSQANAYIGEVKNLTSGGVHAAAVFSAATVAYKGAPALIRPGGVLMVVGIPADSLQASAMDLVIGNYRIRAESTSIPQRMKKKQWISQPSIKFYPRWRYCKTA
ncbi:uncharacterized protein N7483_011169 [Penicillium malachiteum]|uniref:uncharacterized protein n=1 Tax=Penicillium malachiteum TaxID=1324776 RepID=UPI002547EF20|nr:uncharacterized protein N7483_011169 [Penicillium malachiteum]KAJ5713988.1 hypothetical protein N7483_011169 [Penicillium malachiteum]